MFDFALPLFLNVVEGVRVDDGEADEENIGIPVAERTESILTGKDIKQKNVEKSQHAICNSSLF